MKFPKKLSKERLSLLSAEDLAIYNKEHRFDEISSLKKNEDVSYAMNINEEDDDSEETVDNDEATNESIVFDNTMFEQILSEEMDNLYYELMSEEVDYDTYISIKEEMMNLYNSENAINEEELTEDDILLTEGAEGNDAYSWIRGLKLGWLGKIAGLGLAGLGTGIAALLVAGKDKLALARLKKYMNKLVELTDQGVYKKQSWYAAIMPKRNNEHKLRGEWNMGCFRTIQEAADRNMCLSVMQAAHKLGFFKANGMKDIKNGSNPQPGSGLDLFNENVVNKINVVITDK